MHSPLAPPPAAPTVKPSAAGLSSFTVAGAVVVLAAVVLTWVLATEVRAKQPEMGDRFLIPLASCVLVYLLWPRWQTLPERPALAGLLFVAPGAVLFSAGWYLLVHVGPRTILLWWLAGSVILAAVGLLLLRFGWPRTRALLFPLVFGLLALPTPDVIQQPLQYRLKDVTTAGAAAVLPWLGVPAERHGFTLALPSGDLGVVDACSGALSLTALTAISLLVGYSRRTFRHDFTIPRAVALFVLTVPIVAVSNTTRVVATGVLKEALGDWAIQGFWHELLGYLVILVGFALIVGTSQLLALKAADNGQRAAGSEDRTSASSLPAARGGAWALALLVPALAACVWSEQFRQAHRLVVNLDDLPHTVAGWQSQAATPDPVVTEMLKCDQLLCRRYFDEWGQKVEVYVMFWATPASTAHMHHPDICWTCQGWTTEASHVQPVPYADGRAPLGVSARHFVRKDKWQVVFYWTQNGRTVLPDGQEPTGHSEYAWIGTLLRGHQPLARTSRLSVLLGTDVEVGRSELPAAKLKQHEAKLEQLAAGLAADLYRLCPWAEPEE